MRLERIRDVGVGASLGNENAVHEPRSEVENPDGEPDKNYEAKCHAEAGNGLPFGGELVPLRQEISRRQRPLDGAEALAEVAA